MKLYATTTSERASKGQGGNKEIHTQFYCETENGREVVADFQMINYGAFAVIKYQKIVNSIAVGIPKELDRIKLKGERQKDDLEIAFRRVNADER